MSPTDTRWAILALLVMCHAILVAGNVFKLVFLHNNDIHGRFEETERNSGSCKPKHRNKVCIGGMARTAHVVRAFRQRAEKGSGPPVLYLNAGDTFVGTAWFSVFTYKISAAFMNIVKPDAVCVGNHEFDFRPKMLAEFAEQVTTPVLAANLDFAREPVLQGKVKSSVVLQVAGRKVGIIGYLTPETIKISSTGKVAFENEVKAIRREAKKLSSQGVNIIVALGHSGYEMDKTIAKEVEQVDVVIGGHTNTFLYNGRQPDMEPIDDPYPKVIKQRSGKRVPVVQAYAYTKYLGVLNCSFNNNGDLTHFAGNNILMVSSIPQEADVLELLETYRPDIDALDKEILGYSRAFLDGDNYNCRHKECNLGNLVTDGLVYYAASESSEKWSKVPIAIYNGGGIRNSISPNDDTGAITRGDLIAVLPFGNQVVELTLKGSDLLLALEQMVRSQGETSSGEFPQVSGLKLVVDMRKKPYSRVVSLKARCGVCQIPLYKTVDPALRYTLVTSSYLASGGDGITVFSEKFLSKKVMDKGDLDVVAEYIKKHSPIYPEIEGRIIVINAGQTICGSWNLMMMVLVVIEGLYILKLNLK